MFVLFVAYFKKNPIRYLFLELGGEKSGCFPTKLFPLTAAEERKE